MTTLEAPALRSQRLNLATHAPHQRLDNAVKAHEPFASRENFTPFVVAQYLFQSELQALYQDAELGALFPDLPERCRALQAKADLADLGAEVPAPVAGAITRPSRAEALGWLFVSEGSKLGAAFLIKRVAALGLDENFGARHLGEPSGGRAEGWKRFTRTLDGLALSAAEEREAEAGALAAFDRFGVLLQHAYEHAAARA
ncbi:biliverdin-producing heme oxygenase [Pseudomonas delhiensis]|uniref:biliverdin-producing heme oxygenase n=1 Tax=Pseudomonas delhiensis TaxID=366289 RepID=UPI00315ABAF1